MTEAYKKAFFIDIDGTLIGNSFAISKRTERAVLQAQKNGHYMFINTGRALGNIPAQLRKVISLFDGISAGSGTYIRVGERVLSDVSVAPDILTQITKDIEADKKLWAVYEGKYTIIGQNGVPPEWNTKLKITDNENFSTAYAAEPVEVIAIGKKVPAAFYEKYGSVLQIIQMNNFADCIPLGCSKALGMRAMLAHIGIPIENSIAIGDSENDLSMLAAAGHSCAVANAASAVLESVQEITDANTEDGVAKMIEKYCL